MFEQNLLLPNALRLESRAFRACVIDQTSKLPLALAYAREKYPAVNTFPLGQGSNVILANTVEKIVLLMQTKGIECIREDKSHVIIKVAAGENWHNFVISALTNGWHGLENLALIPGTIGAAPVQNIGAYGVEVERFIQSVEVYDLQGHAHKLSTADCHFAYRDSLFKREPGLTISSVTFKLFKQPKIKADYPALAEWLDDKGISTPLPADIAKAVIAVRSAKLPDVEQYGNVGSFFKNPIVNQQTVRELRRQIDNLVAFAANNTDKKSAVEHVEQHTFKLSAAQLIDAAGCKEWPPGPVVCWSTQPLVLVNNSAHYATEVLEFAEKIQQEIESKYSIQLEIEPSIVV